LEAHLGVAVLDQVLMDKSSPLAWFEVGRLVEHAKFAMGNIEEMIKMTTRGSYG
jgi:hypothetical protein